MTSRINEMQDTNNDKDPLAESLYELLKPVVLKVDESVALVRLCQTYRYLYRLPNL